MPALRCSVGALYLFAGVSTLTADGLVGPELNPPQGSLPFNSIFRPAQSLAQALQLPETPEPLATPSEDEVSADPNHEWTFNEDNDLTPPRELRTEPREESIEELPDAPSHQLPSAHDDSAQPSPGASLFQQSENQDLDHIPLPTAPEKPSRSRPSTRPRKSPADPEVRRRSELLQDYFIPQDSRDAQSLWGGKIPAFIGPQASDINWNNAWLNQIDRYLAQRQESDSKQLEKLKDEFQRLQMSVSRERAARARREEMFRDQLRAGRERTLRQAIEERRQADQPVVVPPEGAAEPAPTLPTTPADNSTEAAAPVGEKSVTESPATPDSANAAGVAEPSAENQEPASESSGTLLEDPTAASVSEEHQATADEVNPAGPASSTDSGRRPAQEQLTFPTVAKDFPTYPALETSVDRPALADNLFASGQTARAAEIYRLLLQEHVQSKKPANSESLWYEYQLASCYRRLGDRSQAEKYFRLVAAAKEDERLSEYARWWLKRLPAQAEMQQRLQQLNATMSQLEEQLK